MADGLTTLLTSAVALTGMVGFILLLGRLLRSTSLIRPVTAGRVLVVKDSIALDARRRLHLIEHDGRAVLLLTGGNTDLVVGWLDGPRTQEPEPP